MNPPTPDRAPASAIPAPDAASDAGRRRAALRRAALLLAVGLPILGATAAAGRYWWPATETPRLSLALPGADVPLAARAVAPEVPEAAPVWQPAFALPDTPALPRLAADAAAEAPLPAAAQARIAPVGARTQPAAAAPVAAGTAPNAIASAPADLPAAQRSGSAALTDPSTTRRPAEPSDTTERAEATAPLVTGARPPVTPPARPASPTLAATLPVATAETALTAGLARSPVPPARPARLARRPEAPGVTGTAAIVPVSLATPAESLPAATLALAPPLASDAAPDRCDSRLTRAIPRRAAGAEGGQAALARLAGTAGAARDAAIVDAIAAGNLPDHLRGLVPVTLTGTGTDGRPARITLCVMPDYLALGSDQDFVRVPLGLPAARAIAERFDMVLPTTLMVDAIHTQARLRLTPAPMTPGPQMESTDYFLRHNATLEGQRRATGAPLGVLVSGHKKDVVLTNRLESNPGRVAIYGWHQASGRPIQPLSTVHGAQYADYSHGIRLVSRTAWVNGRATDLRDLLADSRLAGLLSHEGPIAPRVMLAALR